MEQTQLELALEKYLQENDFKLEDRVFAEDLDYQASFEDCLTGDDSSLPKPLKFMKYLQGKISEEQINRGDQPTFFSRNSSVLNGLAFQYHVYTSAESNSEVPKKFADEIIKNRAFGKMGGEAIWIFYEPDMKWKVGTVSSRFLPQLIREFYDSAPDQLNFYVDHKGMIDITNHAREDDYDGCQIIRGSLEGIEREFNKKRLDEQNIQKLGAYLRELKELVV